MDRIDTKLPPSLGTRVEHAYGPLGYCNKSEFVRAAIREKLASEEDRLPDSATPNSAPADA